MFICDCLYKDNCQGKERKRKFIKLHKHGIAYINLKEKGLDSGGIVALLRDIDYIRTVYKKACKKIVFRCAVFYPLDKLTYILFESILYDLVVNQGYIIGIAFKEVKTNISTEGLRNSTVNISSQERKNIEKYKRKFYFEQSRTHFRRIFTKEQSEGSGISSLLGELKTFFLTSDLEKSNTDQLANVICELVDNVGEHTEADCLIDVDVSQEPYSRDDDDGEYLAVNTVILNFDDKCLGDDIKIKIENHNFANSDRYEAVERAYCNHKTFFSKEYNKEDFFNLVSFQDGISGRNGETITGGTGLTQLIKSLENRAADHGCYVLSGNQGLFFYPEHLEYNNENWIGFNENNNFISEKPNDRVLLRSNAYLRGTAYNLTLVYRRNA